jgi:hypothetical protein
LQPWLQAKNTVYFDNDKKTYKDIGYIYDLEKDTKWSANIEYKYVKIISGSYFDMHLMKDNSLSFAISTFLKIDS